jgi:hypothetical protein
MVSDGAGLSSAATQIRHGTIRQVKRTDVWRFKRASNREIH